MTLEHETIAQGLQKVASKGNSYDGAIKVLRLNGNDTYLIIGPDGSPILGGIGEGDVSFTGDVEFQKAVNFHDTFYVRKRIVLADSKPMTFGYGWDIKLTWQQSSAPHYFAMGISNYSNVMILTREDYVAKDHNLTAADDPTFYVFSGVNPTTNSGSDNFFFRHDRTDAYFYVNKGNFRVDGGGIKIKRTTTAASYVIDGQDYYVGVTDTSSARTLTLPDPSSVGDGFQLKLKDESGAAGTNAITINPNSSETIDGAASISISSNYGKVQLITDGTNWFTI